MYRTPTIYGSDHGSTGDRIVEISRVAQNRMRRPEYARNNIQAHAAVVVYDTGGAFTCPGTPGHPQ